MTILNKSIFPELAITQDATYDSPNATAWLNSDGLRIAGGGVKLEAGTTLTIDPAATVVGLVTPAALATAVADKVSSTSMSTALLAKADASAVRRIDTYSGSTDSNGLFTVVYPVPFAAIPTVQPEPPAAANQTWIKVASSTTGFSLRLVQRNSVTLLATELLLASAVNVVGAACRANAVAV